MTTSSSMSIQSPQTWIPLGVGVSLILFGGALYGSYSQRWGPSQDLLGAAGILASVPDRIGAWISVEDFPIEKSAVEMLECAGYINRRYQNSETGQMVNVAILVGPPGPIAVHTPEVCFSSRAYDQETERDRVEVGSANGDDHSFWSVDFVSKNVLANRLRVYYAWSVGNTWVASQSPRYEYAAAPGLYKLQLATEISPGRSRADEDAGRDFLEALTNSEWQRNRQERMSPVRDQ